jgi:hypothetical protein
MNKTIFLALSVVFLFSCSTKKSKYEKLCKEKNFEEYNITSIPDGMNDVDSIFKKQLTEKIPGLKEIYPHFDAKYLAFHNNLETECISVYVVMDDKLQIFLLSIREDKIIDFIEVAKLVEDEFFRFESFSKIKEGKIYFTQEEIKGMHWSKGADVLVDIYSVTYSLNDEGSFEELESKRKEVERKVGE